MDLNRHARELYELRITTTSSSGNPVGAGAWEASFDNGTTWVGATVIAHDGQDWSTWLVAGDRANPTGAVAVVRSSVVPLVRLTDSPEIVVRDAPGISVEA